MKKKYLIGIFLISLFLTSCNVMNNKEFTNESTDSIGDLQVEIDLTIFNARSNDTVISSVDVHLVRTNYTTIDSSLTIANNVASGTIEDLDEGVWSITAEVYDDTNSLIYTGNADVTVIAGATVTCTLLFDPAVPDTPTKGTIDFVVGINPVPYYKSLGTGVTQILTNDTEIYVLTSSTKTISVYDESLSKIKDIVLVAAPDEICLNYEKDKIICGYTNGHIYLLDIETESFDLVGDSLLSIENIEVIDATQIFLTDGGYATNTFKTMDITTGQIIDSHSYYYISSNIVVSKQVLSAFAYSTGSPRDIERVTFDASGQILSNTDSPYHGDYSMGNPLRMIKDETTLITGSGTMFSTLDLTYSGDIGMSFTDLVGDGINGKLFILSSNSGLNKLVIVDDTTFFTDLTIDLDQNATLSQIYQTSNNIIVILELDGEYYVKSFVKSDYI